MVFYMHPAIWARHEIHDGKVCIFMFTYLIKIGVNLITVYRPPTSNVASTSRAMSPS